MRMRKSADFLLARVVSGFWPWNSEALRFVFSPFSVHPPETMGFVWGKGGLTVVNPDFLNIPLLTVHLLSWVAMCAKLEWLQIFGLEQNADRKI